MPKQNNKRAVAKAITVKIKNKNVKKRQPKRNKNPRKTKNVIRRNNITTVSDNLNTGTILQNNSMLEQRFKTRMEKVANLTGATAFTISNALYLNPGNNALFPIFSQEAAVYEQYRCNVLKFHYKTREYTASGSNVGAGLVLMATNFDPDDGVFTSDTQMENYWHSTSGPPFTKWMTHDVLAGHKKQRGGTAMDATLNNYYVYSSANSSSPLTGATKFYDMGLFQQAVSGNVSSSDIIGELWVEYSFTMIHPKQQTPSGQNILCAHITESANGTAAASGSNFLGTTGGVLRSGSTIPCVMTKSTFTIPYAGNYQVNFTFYGGVTVVPTFSLGSNITSSAIYSDNAFAGASLDSVSSGSATGSRIYSVSSNGTGSANTVTISGLTSLSAGTADIFITAISGGLTSISSKPPILQADTRLVELERKFELLMKTLDKTSDFPPCLEEVLNDNLTRYRQGSVFLNPPFVNTKVAVQDLDDSPVHVDESVPTFVKARRKLGV